LPISAILAWARAFPQPDEAALYVLVSVEMAASFALFGAPGKGKLWVE
jgi:hypothetical protein